MDLDIDYLGQTIENAIANGIRDGLLSIPQPSAIELRDFFAGCALAGWCSQENGTVKGDAAAAYIAADAMLLARGQITAQDIADTQEKCERCEGEGYIVVLLGPHEVLGGGSAAGPVEQKCPDCSGTGKTPRKKSDA